MISASFDKKIVWLLLIALILCTFFVYGDFLTGQRGFVFGDIGADSHFQTYPMLVHGANYIRTEGLIPTWSFTAGTGMTLYGYYTPFDWPILLAGADNVPYMMGLMQAVKVVLAGMLFFAYLCTIGIKSLSAATVAICYAFCGHIIARGTWISYPNETVCAALMLLGFELCFEKGKKWLLPLTLAFSFITLRGYYVCLYSALMLGYAVFRYFVQETHSMRFWPYFGCVVGYILLGVGLSAVIVLPQFITILDSARLGISGASLSGWMAHRFDNIDLVELIIACLRVLSSDMIGSTTIMTINRGTGADFLSGPLFYCGLITLPLVPQALVSASKRERIWYSVILLAAVAYMVIPALRYVCNGLVRPDFKLSSFWIVIFSLYIAARGLNRLEAGGKANGPLLGLSMVMIVTPLLYLWKNGNNIQPAIVVSVLAFLGFYMLILCMDIGQKKSICILLACAVLCEAGLFSSRLMKSRIAVGDEASREYDAYYNYNDGTKELVEDLQVQDETTFYRTDKAYISTFLCDSLIQDYYGIASYQGGGAVMHTAAVTAFFEAVGGEYYIPGISHYITGLYDKGEIDTLLGVKYILAKSEDYQREGYVKTVTRGGITAYENQYALPLGFTYDKLISETDFMIQSVEKRQNTIFQAAVLPDADARNAGIPVYSGDSEDVFSAIKARGETPMTLSSFSNTKIEGRIRTEKKSVLFLSVPYDRGWHLYVDGQRAPLQHVNIGFIGTVLSEGSHTIQLRYLPPYIEIGMGLSLASLATYVYILSHSKKERRAG